MKKRILAVLLAGTEQAETEQAAEVEAGEASQNADTGKDSAAGQTTSASHPSGDDAHKTLIACFSW